MKEKLLKLAALFLVLNISLVGMTPEEFEEKKKTFETEEYKWMGGLDLINAAGAYALGYTGKGVTLGICDQYVNFTHNEFKNKENSFVIGGIPEDIDWGANLHGTHVGGIISAAKDGAGMHGVTFDSELISGRNYYIEDTNNISLISMVKSSYEYFDSRNDIKVINNSWASKKYIDEFEKGGLSELREEIKNDMWELDKINESAKKYGKLLIFGNANFGHMTPSLIPLMTYADEEVKNNIIGVTAVNGNYASKESQFLAVYSDLNKYNEENSISAPGTNIISPAADFEFFEKKYLMLSGTSMAAPMVTGVGGLVQEAFPYMSGKQIGDVLLSTANKKNDGQQEYTLTFQQDYFDSIEDFFLKEINLIYFDEIGDRNIKDDILEYLKTSIKNNDEYFIYLFPDKDITDEEIWEMLIDEMGLIINVYENVPYEIVYGQGIVDAGKAVKGLGALNARRLTKKDKSDYNERLNNDKFSLNSQALYTINTMGYDSVWSNNISEIKVGHIAPKGGYNDLINNQKYSNDDLKLDKDEKEYFDKLYEFYTNEEFRYDFDKDNGSLTTTDSSSQVVANGKEYIAEYNRRVDENGLAGLSVGLLKEGEGTLALTGKNTYNGASIAGEGTLQIDRSITGDAYSLNDDFGIGTIAGSGTIGGNLYNYGKVQAGSWGEIGKLTVNGDFISDEGTIVVNIQGTKNSTLEVLGTISEFKDTKIEINGIVIPDTTYKNFLEAGKVTEGILDGVSGNLSLFLGYDVVEGVVKTAGKNYDLKVEKTAALDSLSGISREQRKIAGILEGMYSSLSGQEEQRELDIFYNIKDKSTAERAFQETYGGLHTDMINNLPLNNRISSSIYSRLGDKKDIFTKEKNEIIELEDKMWTEVLTSWKDIDSSRGMESLEIDMKGFILGGEFYNSEAKKFGYFLSYGENDIKGDSSSGEIRDIRGGLYLGHTAGKYSLESYAALGYQDNEAERNLAALGLKAESDYNSWTVEAGAKGSVTLTENIKPYIELNILRNENESFSEKGAGVLSQNISKSKNIHTTAGAGIELTKNWKYGKGNLLLGYERVLTGYDPELRANMTGSSNFKVKGHKQDKDYMIVKAGGEKNLKNGITIYGDIESRFSSKEKDYALTIGAKYSF